jgi:hypothetical protein
MQIPLTEEQLAALTPEARKQIETAFQTSTEIETAMSKIRTRPSAMKALEALNTAAELGWNMPEDPIAPYVKPFEDKINGLQDELRLNKEEKLRETIRQRMSEMDLPESEAEKIGAFQTAKQIGDPLAAIELYAKTEYQREAPIVGYQPNLHRADGVMDEATAMAKTISELNNFKRSHSRR